MIQRKKYNIHTLAEDRINTGLQTATSKQTDDTPLVKGLCPMCWFRACQYQDNTLNRYIY